MKSLFLTGVLILSFYPSAHAYQSQDLRNASLWTEFNWNRDNPDDWYFVGGANGQLNLIRPSSIKRKGTVVEVWNRVIFKSDGATVQQRKIQFDCVNETARKISAVIYFDPESIDGLPQNRKKLNKPLTVFFTIDTLEPISPNSTGETMMRAACTLGLRG